MFLLNYESGFTFYIYQYYYIYILIISNLWDIVRNYELRFSVLIVKI
jgi:hypothetical protein